MTYKLNHIRYDWKHVTALSVAFGLIFFLAALVILTAFLYYVEGVFWWDLARGGGLEGQIARWVLAMLFCSAVGIVAVLVVILSVIILTYNHIAVKTFGGLRFDIRLRG